MEYNNFGVPYSDFNANSKWDELDITFWLWVYAIILIESNEWEFGLSFQFFSARGAKTQ